MLGEERFFTLLNTVRAREQLNRSKKVRTVRPRFVCSKISERERESLEIYSFVRKSQTLVQNNYLLSVEVRERESGREIKRDKGNFQSVCQLCYACAAANANDVREIYVKYALTDRLTFWRQKYSEREREREQRGDRVNTDLNANVCKKMPLLKTVKSLMCKCKSA